MLRSYAIMIAWPTIILLVINMSLKSRPPPGYLGHVDFRSYLAGVDFVNDWLTASFESAVIYILITPLHSRAVKSVQIYSYKREEYKGGGEYGGPKYIDVQR